MNGILSTNRFLSTESSFILIHSNKYFRVTLVRALIIEWSSYESLTRCDFWFECCLQFFFFLEIEYLLFKECIKIRGEYRTRFFVLFCFLPSPWRAPGQYKNQKRVLPYRTGHQDRLSCAQLWWAFLVLSCPVLLLTFVLEGGRTGPK